MKKLLLLVLIIAAAGVGALLYHNRKGTVNVVAKWVKDHYRKKTEYIKMRDGVKLCTIIYEPISNTEPHPILIERTPYSIPPYDASIPPFWDSYLLAYMKEGYILVYQDVRGKFMSEGTFEELRPFKADKKGNETDEASDAYDTIDWLIKNEHSNNKVGVMGYSYPGYYAVLASMCGHPALKAICPQAPICDWFIGDDWHHNGAFMAMEAFTFYKIYGLQRPAPSQALTSAYLNNGNKDNYKFFLETGCVQNLTRLMGDSVKFWKELMDHPDYDDWWKTRNTANYVKHIPDSIASLMVGGLFDAEDYYGTWELYKKMDNESRREHRIVIGPWEHGGWVTTKGDYLGNVRFGSATTDWYHKNVEVPFFNYHLKGKGDIREIKKATVFFTGTNQWKKFDKWPADDVKNTDLFLRSDSSLSFEQPIGDDTHSRGYRSDPANPVPYIDGIHMQRAVEYMDDDQRFAAGRHDVLVYQTDTLTRDVTLGGPVTADLYTSISTTDADFVVKLIDVFPANFKYIDSIDGKGNDKNYPMGGYQMLVRGDIMRGRYRNSFENPEAFKPGTITEVKYRLQDVAHVFKKGHRIMVQVQSSWFPLADRNPQQFVNIYKCSEKDFIPSDIHIFSSASHPSRVVLPIMNNLH